MRRTLPLTVFGLLQALTVGPAGAHQGGLDANGCHYETTTGRYHCHREGKPNPDVTAPVKKSRENVCHDKSSPNYKTIKYFIAYDTMPACLTSGGRAPA